MPDKPHIQVEPTPVPHYVTEPRADDGTFDVNRDPWGRTVDWYDADDLLD